MQLQQSGRAEMWGWWKRQHTDPEPQGAAENEREELRDEREAAVKAMRRKQSEALDALAQSFLDDFHGRASKGG